MKLIKYITTAFLLVAIASFVLVSCYKEDATPQASNTLTAANVTPLEGSGGTLVTVTGTGLGQIKSVVFANQNVPASFNPGLNSDGVVMFRVPDTAYGGVQDVILTNTLDKQLKISFKVIALATISGASAFEFEGGSSLTLMGNNLESVTSVVLDGTTDAATIVSKNKKELVLTMPASNADKAKLKITNSSGVVTTTQEFANLAKAFIWFKDAMGPNIQDWSWCSVHAVTTSQKLQGSASMEAKYGNGAWQGLSFYTPNAFNAGGYSYMSFWIKGGTQDNAMKIYSDQGGTPVESFPVPANVWTYVKVPMTGFLGGVANLQRINFQMRGPNNADQTVYFDNVIFVK
jgi:hypothetical protein